MSQPIWLRELALFSLFIWFSDPHSKSVWVTIIPILLTGKPRYREVKKPKSLSEKQQPGFEPWWPGSGVLFLLIPLFGV
jgi:hypothetical protein